MAAEPDADLAAAEAWYGEDGARGDAPAPPGAWTALATCKPDEAGGGGPAVAAPVPAVPRRAYWPQLCLRGRAARRGVGSAASALHKSLCPLPTTIPLVRPLGQSALRSRACRVCCVRRSAPARTILGRALRWRPVDMRLRRGDPGQLLRKLVGHWAAAAVAVASGLGVVLCQRSSRSSPVSSGRGSRGITAVSGAFTGAPPSPSTMSRSVSTSSTSSSTGVRHGTWRLAMATLPWPYLEHASFMCVSCAVACHALGSEQHRQQQ